MLPILIARLLTTLLLAAIAADIAGRPGYGALSALAIDRAGQARIMLAAEPSRGWRLAAQRER